NTDARHGRALSVVLLWPEGVTDRGAKVRVWGRPGARVSVSEGGAAPAAWQDRPLEAAPPRGLATLGAQGRGPELPLALLVEDTAGPTQAALVGDRALLRVEV